MNEQKFRQLHIVIWNDSKMITAYTINGNICSTVFRCTEAQLGSMLVIEKLTKGCDTILIHTEKEWLDLVESKEE